MSDRPKGDNRTNPNRWGRVRASPEAPTHAPGRPQERAERFGVVLPRPTVRTRHGRNLRPLRRRRLAVRQAVGLVRPTGFSEYEPHSEGLACCRLDLRVLAAIPFHARIPMRPGVGCAFIVASSFDGMSRRRRKVERLDAGARGDVEAAAVCWFALFPPSAPKTPTIPHTPSQR